MKTSCSTLRLHAEVAAAARLREMSGPLIFREQPPGYTSQPEFNLVPGISMADFAADLNAGAGKELTDDSRGPAKFCAAFSSSALAVNTFGPFRCWPRRLELLGHTGFSATQFEKKLPTGLRGTDPHLDFYAAGTSQIICIESKFLELLWPKRAAFAESYDGAVQVLAEPTWAELFRKLKRDPKLFQHLDAAQLVKHYLGMRNTFGGTTVKQMLVYLFWEPVNASEIAQYRSHREETAAFGAAVRDSRIDFVALSYPELWAGWASSPGWSGMAAHLAHLEQRYSFCVVN